MKRSKTAQRLILFTIGVVVIGVSGYLCRRHLLTALGRYLVVDDPLQPADCLFLLNGGEETRPFHAGKLYREGFAPQVVIAQVEETPVVALDLYPSPTEVAVAVMERTGVTPDAIVVRPFPGGVTSTRDEAVVLRRYVEQYGVERVILVTSAFHTRRARWIVERELAGTPVVLQVAAAPEYGFDANNWWQTERGLIALATEYIKLVYYHLRY